jgi:hypothetical protein
MVGFEVKAQDREVLESWLRSKTLPGLGDAGASGAAERAGQLAACDRP